ncbi:MAG: sigma-70 family RNA polymerase sigma factor [Planctomycetes bacterium]|nr:sigma-70 family RNA polymerase sigma factor [Planctomycetota bacterium]
MDHPPEDLPSEPLVEEVAFVRALARELIHDEHDAEDLAQDALLAGLSNAPSERAALRPWLARVVRNASIDQRRRSATRAHVERVSARAEGLPSAAEQLEHETARRALHAALHALDEPYRTALRLRFLEELAPREIARTLGVPVETARTRIKRGLERLRAELDRRSNGRAAWGVALAGWLASVENAAARNRLVARGALGATAAVLVGLWLFVPRLEQRAAGVAAERADAASPTRDLAAVEDAAERRTVVPAGGERAAGRSTSGGAASGGAAIGRVRFADGQAAAFADLLVWPGDDARVVDGRFVGTALHGRADVHGNFELGGLPAEFVLFAHVASAASPSCVVVRAANVKRYAELELELVELAVLTGSLHDDAGRPLDSVELELRPAPTRIGPHPTGRRDSARVPALAFATRTDAAGGFEFPWLVPGRYRVHVDGRALGSELGVSSGAQLVHLVERAEATPHARAVAWEIAGRVVDADDGAEVSEFDACVLDASGSSCEASRDGAFRLHGQATADAWLWLGSASRAHELVRLDAAVGRTEPFELAREASLALRIVDGDGAPLAHAQVAFEELDGRPRIVPVGGRRWADVARTDARGRVDALALPRRALRIAVARPNESVAEFFVVDLADGFVGERTVELASAATRVEYELELDFAPIEVGALSTLAPGDGGATRTSAWGHGGAPRTLAPGDSSAMPTISPGDGATTSTVSLVALDANGEPCARALRCFADGSGRAREPFGRRELSLAADGRPEALVDIAPGILDEAAPAPGRTLALFPRRAVRVEVRDERGVLHELDLPRPTDGRRVRVGGAPR